MTDRSAADACDNHALTETQRLERLWSGEFGDAYVERNRAVGDKRGPFWVAFLRDFAVSTVLEIGCNIGVNLAWLASRLPPQNLYGIEINRKALKELHRALPDVNAVWGLARELPFRDQRFDLTFTAGVLIHQPESTLPLVMAEVVRCSRRYVLCAEYSADCVTEIAYRGQTGALFKRDYGRLYSGLFPDLQLRKQGFLGRDDGWDDVTFWVFEKG
jgi:pseudaminic acid biosynthesis-associated methylase